MILEAAWNSFATFPLIASALVAAIFAVPDLARIGLMAMAAVIAVSGIAQLHLAMARGRDHRHPRMRKRIRAERGVARLWLASALALAAVCALSPLLLAAAVGTVLAVALVVVGIASGYRSARQEDALQLPRRTAREECSRFGAVADAVASIPWPRLGCLARLAGRKASPGEIGVLPYLSLVAGLIACFGFVGTAAAIVVADALDREGDGGTSEAPIVVPTPNKPEPADDAGDEKPPSYAELCPQIPDPLEIGHGLGELFRRDSAIKAGCGSWPIQVPSSGTWVAAGICDGETRSVAVAPRVGEAVILYGEGARFAWSAAVNNELIGAETTEPAGGDVYLIETFQGVFAFARRSPSIEPGREDIERCDEATGLERPFVRLPPQLTMLWLELIRYRAQWSWPVKDLSGAGDQLSFLSHPHENPAASARCEQLACELEVDEESGRAREPHSSPCPNWSPTCRRHSTDGPCRDLVKTSERGGDPCRWDCGHREDMVGAWTTETPVPSATGSRFMSGG